MVTEGNKFHTLQEVYEINTPNDENENFVTADKEAAVSISTKPRAKRIVHGSQS